MALAASCWLGFAGLFWLAASLQRHERVVARGPPSKATRRRLRWGGTLLLLAAPWPWMLAYDAALALTAWLFCVTPLAAVAVAVSLAFCPTITATAVGARLVSPR